MASFLQACVRVHTKNIIHNLQIARQQAPQARVLAIVKAELYGHRINQVVETIEKNLLDDDVLGVTDLPSAEKLRSLFKHRRLLLLHGVFNQQELTSCINNNIEMVVHCPNQIDLLSSLPQKSLPLLWLKVDSGMGRLGFSSLQVESLIDKIKALKPHCLMSHFACADEPLSPLNEKQKKSFASFKKRLSKIPYSSLANSAAILHQLTPMDSDSTQYIRPGIMLYGGFPNNMSQKNSIINTLLPTMSFEAPVISLKKAHKGMTVGYGADWVAPEDGYIATLKAGYADGYPRALGDKAQVFFEGQYYPVVGRVSMDLMAIYLHPSSYQPNAFPKIKIGDRVELWGKNLDIRQVAEKADTIAYELLTQIADRVPRFCDD